MSKSSSVITAAMLTIGITIVLSQGWLNSVTQFIESKINDPKDPSNPKPVGESPSGVTPVQHSVTGPRDGETW